MNTSDPHATDIVFTKIAGIPKEQVERRHVAQYIELSRVPNLQNTVDTFIEITIQRYQIKCRAPQHGLEPRERLRGRQGGADRLRSLLQSCQAGPQQPLGLSALPDEGGGRAGAREDRQVGRLQLRPDGGDHGRACAGKGGRVVACQGRLRLRAQHHVVLRGPGNSRKL
eukprot:scaffold109545_cov47-Prasinocladus_malaysianus.AAC.1